MHRRTLVLRAVVASFAVAVLGVMVLLSFLLVAVPVFFPVQVPLLSVGGMARVDDRVYIASSATGRVSEYSADGGLLKWRQMPKRPISLVADGDQLIVHYSGGERIVRTGVSGRLWPASALRVEHTWWGHPSLVLSEDGRERRVPLQPWYLTAMQAPWPAWLCVPLLIVSVLVTSKAWERVGASRVLGEHNEQSPNPPLPGN